MHRLHAIYTLPPEVQSQHHTALHLFPIVILPATLEALGTTASVPSVP